MSKLYENHYPDGSVSTSRDQNSILANKKYSYENVSPSGNWTGRSLLDSNQPPMSKITQAALNFKSAFAKSNQSSCSPNSRSNQEIMISEKFSNFKNPNQIATERNQSPI